MGTINHAIDWPVWPDSTIHRIGNGYAQYQYYPGYADPFMHTGIDILVPIGTPVYSVKAGWVKSILTSSGDMHWRIVIGDTPGVYSECNGYMYSHLEQSSMTVEAGLQVGDYVEEGQFIGRIVHYTWVEDTTIVFDHLHFSKVHDYEWTDFSTWEYIANPFDSLENIYDPDPPVFEDAIPGQLFGFCYNLVPLYYDSCIRLHQPL
jgi:murein DD-endopeptidase MepM/ murein hydrolase activator NlpD